MIQFKVNGEFLDLLPGTVIQMEEENPYLQFDDEVRGSYSFPFSIPVTERNMRLLGFPTRLHSVKTRKIDAICYDNDLQHSVGYIKIETSRGNLNAWKKGSISCYYLIASSYFFQDVKDKRLSSLNWGGVRVFSHGSFNKSSSYFWKHIHDCANGNSDSYNYTFFPLYNSEWTSEGGYLVPLFQNAWSRQNGEFQFVTYTFNSGSIHPVPITPFPYLVYVLKNIFREVGWEVKGDIFNDPTFKKIVLISFRDIPCMKFNWLFAPTPTSTVSFDLKDYLPDLTISEFLIAIKNRFGLVYDFDRLNKVCTIRQLSTVVDTNTLDLSPYVDPNYDISVEDGKRYSIEEIGEWGGGRFTINQSEFKGAVGNFNLLPTASESREGNIYFVRQLNAYFFCRINEQGVYVWEKMTDNNFDYIPENYTDSITTASSAVIMITAQVNYTGFNFSATFPQCNRPGAWKNFNDIEAQWGIILATYHGIRVFNGSPVPHASNHVIDSVGDAIIADFALTFEFKASNGKDYGLYEKFYRKFLETIDDSETVKVTANMPQYLYNSLRFAQSLVVDHSRYYLRKKNSTIPYSGKVTLELVKA